MNQPIEDLMRRMSLKHPSDKLDQRMAELIVEHQMKSLAETQAMRRGRWARLAATAAVFLLLGLAAGFLIADRSVVRFAAGGASAESVATSLGPSHNAAQANENEAGNDSSPIPNATAAEVAPVDSTEPRTRIVNERMVRTEAGDLRRAYQTLTPKKYLLFDTEKKSFVHLNINVPRIIVTSRPEI